jgi:uncharacterized protein (TIGR00288 family)
MLTETDRKIAVLVDADNTQLQKMDAIMAEISARGRIVVKRVYGNWKKAGLSKWEQEIKRLGINARQQFDYVRGKNATDMALVIDAMDLLAREAFDSFVLVSSDSDFTPLAIRIHESGARVIGVGKAVTPESFRNACDDFVFIENLQDVAQEDKEEPEIEVKTPAGIPKKVKKVPKYVHSLIHKAWDTYRADDDWAKLSAVGDFLKRAKPDFTPKTYGFPKLLNLVESFPEKYKTERRKTPAELPFLFCLPQEEKDA